MEKSDLFLHIKEVEKIMKNTKTASLEELREMRSNGEVKSTRHDAPELDMPEGFWDVAIPQESKTKKQLNMRVDPDIIEYFKAQGNGHLTRMHAVLRSYVDAKTKQLS
jgi:uncharacterized protein (DUF4415 family)